MSEFVIDKVRDYLNDLLPSLGLELFDVQFRREGHGWVLRVFIDREEGVSLDHCSEVSRELGTYLDVEELIDHGYNLEVSSPGLERPLRSLNDFSRFTGKKAKLRFRQPIDGEKVFEGDIDRVEGETVYFKTVDGSIIEFSFEMLNKARLAI